LPAPVRDALRRADLVLHAGDLATAAVLAELETFAPVVAVAGNVDEPALRARLPRRAIVPVGRFRVGLVHGDGETGTTLRRAEATFASDAVDCVVFGHSHQPLLEERAGRLYLNPGSPTDKRRAPGFSFAWLHAGESLVPEVIYF
jgi:putative phosphoesterase